MSVPWSKKSRKSLSSSTSRWRRTLPLQLESLEDRSLPAVLSSNTVAGLYFDVLHREASQGELNIWNPGDDQGVTPTSGAMIWGPGSQNEALTLQNLFGQRADGTLASMTPPCKPAAVICSI